MGYDASLKIKEYDDRFKSYFREASQKDADNYKNLLLGYCLVGGDGERSPVTLEKISRQLDFHVNLYIDYLVRWWKVEQEKRYDSITPDENGYREFNFCGWGYAKDPYGKSSVDDMKKYIYESLFLIAITPTPNRYGSDEERQTYFRKVDDIKDHINDIEETIWDILDKEFFDFYKAKEDTIFDESY